MNHPGSFRDPAGFIFTEHGKVFRQVNESGRADYDLLMSSGLYDELTAEGLLIPHADVTDRHAPTDGGYKVLHPELVEFISYPYEWSFSQLRDAALTTLDILRRALDRGLVLKDASAYNIQFHHGHPVLIDTLSFAAYEDGQPWQAYKQFCQHFLAPLVLMAKVDPGLSKLFVTHIDGIPLPLAARLLPRRTLLSPGLFMHLGLHARTQVKNSGDGNGAQSRAARLSRLNFEALIDSLARTVRGQGWTPSGTEWGDYYSFTNYSDEAFEAKKRLVSELIAKAAPQTAWDLGGNTGEFSRLAAAAGARTICFDIDPVAVERNYRQMKRAGETNHLPLLLDLTNPSPAIGWANAERDNLTSRGPADLIMALALIHHLAISNNLPFDRLAEYFSTLGGQLLIEFVPKSDSKVQALLRTRPDIFPDYTQDKFEEIFGRYYSVTERRSIAGTERTLYLLKKRSAHAA